MPEERCIYSSGREPYFNLNSTWYDPAGSWLDNRRKPFHYVVNTACATCCGRNADVPRRGGHDYRCYCYRRSTCIPGGNPRVTCCVHNPSGGPRDYWGRPIGDSCNGCTGGHYSHTNSCCVGTAGGCGGGGVCSEPCRYPQTFGGATCAEATVGASGGCGGAGVCAEPGGASSGGCGGRRRGVCSEPCARIARAYAEC